MSDLRDACFNTLYDLARTDSNIIFLTADMGAFGLLRFRRDMPDQFCNVGISEQAMLSLAAGLALERKKVVVYSITPFVTLRCYEQIKVDVCGMQLSVVILGIGTGLTYGGDGPTHHSLQDIAVMRALPGMRVYGPSDTASTSWAVRQALQEAGPAYIRMERGVLPDLGSGLSDDRMPARVLCRGSCVGIISTGYMTHRALEAVRLLESMGVSCTLMDMVGLWPAADQVIGDLAREVDLLVTIEEHSLAGGLGGIAAECLLRQEISTPLLALGVPHEFCTRVADREVLLDGYGLSAEGLAAGIIGRWKRLKRRGE